MTDTQFVGGVAFPRRLGALEELFWLYDQSSPVHFSIAAEITGATSVEAWQNGLSSLQRRHPMLSVRIDHQNRSLKAGLFGPIPLRVIQDETVSWHEEFRREVAIPFAPDDAPLVRAVLLHRVDRAAIILTAHHAVADALSLVFALRDLLHAFSGVSLDSLAALPSQESAFGLSTLDAGQLPANPIERRPLDPFPSIDCIAFGTTETNALLAKCREQGTSLQSALCTALACSGGMLDDRWQKQVKLVSPISTREWTQAGEQCCLSIIPSNLEFDGCAAADFWTGARAAHKTLKASRSRDAMAGTLSAIHQLMSTQLDVPAMAQFMEGHFLAEGMVTNLGVIPFGSNFGSLRLDAVWGPATLTVGREAQTIGAVTLGGRLRLTHTSRSPISGLLPATKNLLLDLCTMETVNA